MDASTSDHFVSPVSSSSKTVRPAYPSSDFVQLGEHGSYSELVEPRTTCVTVNDPGATSFSEDDSFITAPEHCQEHSTTNNATEGNRSDLVQDGRLESSQSRQAECRAIFQNIEQVLCKQLHQLKHTLFDAKNLESRLQGLPKEATETSLLLAVCTLTSSLAGVGHIFTGNIAMMEAVNNPSNLAKLKMKNPPATPALSISTVSAEAEIKGDSSDLVLDSTPSDNDIADVTNPHVPDCQSPVTQNRESSEIDPFIDAPREAIASIEASGTEIHLQYHSDFINLFGRRLYVPAPINIPAAERSRRVILRNLPPGAKLPQIVRGIQTQGQILKIALFNAMPIANDATKTAMIEFVSQRQAAIFANTIRVNPLIYEDQNCGQYQADAWLVPTASFGLSWVDGQGVRSPRYTRSLLLKGFPGDYVWYFIDTVGIRHIVRVERDATNDSLCIELTSVWQARRVDGLIWSGRFSDIYKYCDEEGKLRLIVPDAAHISNDVAGPSGIIKHVPEDDLEKCWNTHPYNRPALYLEKEAAQQDPTRLPLQHEIEEDEVEDLLCDFESRKDDDYRIIGSKDIAITRRKWSWSMTSAADMKSLMAVTLHEPDWAEYWDEYFLSRGETNKRTWERYAMLAKHRRGKAAEQGLDLDAIPKCEEGCEMGCQDIKKVPVAAVVKNFFSQRSEG
ncbi:hypothetical protein ACQKWADRAFT_286655 [Trichoderma austrokoningii]